MIQADTGNIQISLKFRGNLIWRFLSNFRNCVGNAQIRGRLIPKITQCVNLVTVVPIYMKKKFRSFFRNPWASTESVSRITFKSPVL